VKAQMGDDTSIQLSHCGATRWVITRFARNVIWGRVNDEHKVEGGAGVDGLNKGPKG
jgi:hypothetical protein